MITSAVGKSRTKIIQACCAGTGKATSATEECQCQHSTTIASRHHPCWDSHTHVIFQAGHQGPSDPDPRTPSHTHVHPFQQQAGSALTLWHPCPTVAIPCAKLTPSQKPSAQRTINTHSETHIYTHIHTSRHRVELLQQGISCTASSQRVCGRRQRLLLLWLLC